MEREYPCGGGQAKIAAAEWPLGAFSSADLTRDVWIMAHVRARAPSAARPRRFEARA
jgi:hypothetical protein